MSYIPFTDNVGVNLALSTAMDSSNNGGTSVPISHDAIVYFFYAALFIIGMSALAIGMVWPIKVRRWIFGIVWTIWGTSAFVWLFAHVGVG
jgi:hypothetical protein